MIFIIDKILILILIIIGLFDIDSHSQEQKRTKKDRSKKDRLSKKFWGYQAILNRGAYLLYPPCLSCVIGMDFASITASFKDTFNKR